MSNSTQRFLVLDVFRALAALAVLFFHFDRVHLEFGRWGVQFFFTISGFVIFKTLENTDSSTDFLIKRFFRLYPTYWICLMLTTLIINVLPNEKFPPVGLNQFLFNLTMVQEMLGFQNIEGSYWSLQPELMFYLFIALIFKMKWEDRIILIGFFWLLLITLNHFFLFEKYFSPIRLLNIRHGGLFFAGILFYKMFNGDRSKIVYFALFLCYFVSLNVYTRLFNFEGALGALTLIFTSFSLFLNNKLSFFTPSFLVFIGTISYPLYLIHQSIGLILMARLNVFCPPIISFCLTFTGLTLAAYLIHILFEKPAQQLSKRYLTSKF